MTTLPTSTHQTYRQIQIPPFAQSIVEEPKVSILNANLGFSSPFPAPEAEPPVGYALELTSLYHPLAVKVTLVGLTEAQQLATQVEIIPRMSLTRAGLLLWEGSPSLSVIRPKGKGALPLIWFVGNWAVQFQNPLIVQSPGELQLNASITFIVTNTEKTGEELKWDYEIMHEAVGPNLQAYLGQGAMGYGLVYL